MGFFKWKLAGGRDDEAVDEPVETHDKPADRDEWIADLKAEAKSLARQGKHDESNALLAHIRDLEG